MQRVLITGGTGTLGRTLVQSLSETHSVTVYSRDEYKQALMRWEGFDCDFVIGDVRDVSRLTHAMDGHDVVIHAAAMKQVGTGHNAGNELLRTNVQGTQNVIEAALTTNVIQLVYVSSDKAMNPINMYGVTKKLGEHMVYEAGGADLQTLVVRWGNVIRSRGSVLERWERTKVINIPSASWTRFWLTRDEAASFLLETMAAMNKKERRRIAYPQMRAANMSVLARAATEVFRVADFGVAYEPLSDEKPHEQIAESESSSMAPQLGVSNLVAIIEADVKRWPL